VAIGVVVVSRIWFAGLGAVTTYLGLLSAGLAIALKDLVADLAGWAFILWRRPFEVGERIQIGDHAGDVIDLRIFQFSLLEIGNWVDADQSTGRILHVPNGRVITDVLANYSRGFQYIWDEQPVLVTFESDWRTAKALLAEVASRHAAHVTGEAARQLEEASRKFMIVYSKLTPIVYTSVKDSGVLLTMRYLCEARKRRAVAEAIWEDVLTEFARRDDIDFAYPTTRFYANPQEGKTAVRAGGPGAPPPPPASPPIAPTEQRR
jgi:small-conductance mechanosensitive channel